MTDLAEQTLPLHGLLAMFSEPEQLLAAARRAHQAGYRRLDAYTPFPVEGLAEALEFHRDRVPLIVLLGAIVGAAGCYFMLYYSAVIDYPINSGGKPLHSWPAFIPITFEMAVLGGALGAFLGMLILNGLPQPYHPLFNVPEFSHESRDRFFLCIEARDGLFEERRTRAFLEDMEPLDVVRVVGEEA
jgi:hypothetical protein